MVQWLNDNPVLATALVVALLNLLVEVLRTLSPAAADIVGSLIPHARSLVDSIAKLRGSNSQPPGGAGAALLLLALSGVAAGLSGCASPTLVAIRVADSAALVGDQAKPVLEQTCIEPIPRATMAELVELRKACDPAMLAYDSLRVAHLSLRGAILAADAGTLDPGKLAPLVVQVGKAAFGLSESIRLVAGAR